MGVSINGVPPKWLVCNGKTIRMDDSEVPLFSETSILIIGIHWFPLHRAYTGEQAVFRVVPFILSNSV